MNQPAVENGIDALERAATSFIAGNSSLQTPEVVREVIESFARNKWINVTPEECELVARRIEANLGVTMSVGSLLVEDDYEPWLMDARKDINPYYWDRYRQLLTQQIGSDDVITKIDLVTDKIVGLLENPEKAGSWDRRGLVMGHVQSGKTANYIGAICKAADAGYKVIIVIAGIHNNLRSQTQQRIDEGFVGRDSARLLSKNGTAKYVGVGNFSRSRVPVTFTTTVRDFNRVIATGVNVPLYNLKEPAVFVIKKNPSTLENLIGWLQEHSAKAGRERIDEPMFLIDDEADNASINIKYGKDGVARINGQLRQLLNLFERSCYVGYTATPFANIFVDPDSEDEMFKDDLFPRNFIVSLDPPSNYFGATKVFLNQDEENPFLKEIDDNEERLPVRHKIDWDVNSLPSSLRTAIRAFILARAIRLLRGHSKSHCSMLVNASRFKNVQSKLRDTIHAKLDQIQRSVKTHGALPPEQALKDHEIATLFKVWKTVYPVSEFEWSQIQSVLHESTSPIQVVEINSRSKDALDYSGYKNSGLNVIAVGGYSLSRGLTLEGLMISYFLRNSMMYDTLMQMGRWFGYRPDYEDLCRIWMPDYAIGWYEHISESIEMLRDELREMEKANATPKEFGLKVRAHPDSLIVTARNKMGTGRTIEMNIGLGNRFVETTTLYRDRDSIISNLNLVDILATDLRKTGLLPEGASSVSGGWLIRNVSASHILKFLSQYKNHPQSMLSDPMPVYRYIMARCDDELKNWDVLLAGTNRSGRIVDNKFGVDINCQSRTIGSDSDEYKIRAKKQRIASRPIEHVGLDVNIARLAEQKFIAAQPGKSFPDRIYRDVRETPLFILHLLDFRDNIDNSLYDFPVTAWSISFPRTNKEEGTTTYMVNTTWVREQMNLFTDDDIQEDDHE